MSEYEKYTRVLAVPPPKPGSRNWLPWNCKLFLSFATHFNIFQIVYNLLVCYFRKWKTHICRHHPPSYLATARIPRVHHMETENHTDSQTDRHTNEILNEWIKYGPAKTTNRIYRLVYRSLERNRPCTWSLPGGNQQTWCIAFSISFLFSSCAQQLNTSGAPAPHTYLKMCALSERHLFLFVCLFSHFPSLPKYIHKHTYIYVK